MMYNSIGDRGSQSSQPSASDSSWSRLFFTCLFEGVEKLTDKFHPNRFSNAEAFSPVDVDLISGYIQAPINSLEVLIFVLED